MDCGVYEFCAAGAVYLLFFVGAVGSFVPVIPGPFLAGLAPLGYKLVFPEGCVSWELAAAGVFAAAFGQIVDFLASWLGAKKFGATKYGIAGAFVGVIAGIFMPPPLFWIFAAPFVFALAFEWIFGGADFRRAARAGLGAFIGNLAASILKFLSVVFLAVWFSFAFFGWI